MAAECETERGRHGDATAVVAERHVKSILTCVQMRQAIHCQSKLSRPAIVDFCIPQLRKDLPQTMRQGFEERSYSPSCTSFPSEIGTFQIF